MMMMMMMMIMIMIMTLQTSGMGGQGGQMRLSIEDGSDDPLNGISTYILRSSSRRALGEETFQREIILGMVDGR